MVDTVPVGSLAPRHRWSRAVGGGMSRRRWDSVRAVGCVLACSCVVPLGRIYAIEPLSRWQTAMLIVVALPVSLGLVTIATAMVMRTYTGFGAMKRDRADQKADRDRLSQLASNLDTALSHMSQGLCLFDAEERVVLANKRLGEMYGLNDTVMASIFTFSDLVKTIIRRREPGERAEAIAAEWYEKHRRLILQPGGGEIIVEANAAQTLSIVHRPAADGSWVTTFEDISDRRKSAVLIAHMALHDHLTDLPNRKQFGARLAQEITHALGGACLVAVVVFDLDRFKNINDVRGQAIGDAVLVRLAERLRNTCGASEFVARFDGDEFAAIKRYRDEAELLEFLSRLEGAIRAPTALNDVELRLAASIGIAIFPRDAATPNQIVNNALLAMHRAKGARNGSICRYEIAMDEAMRARGALAGDLSVALERQEFQVYYQVQQSVSSGEVVGYEALLRWRHPTRGMVSPAEFIPVAEETGAIASIGEWVLRQACVEASVWPNARRVAVNLSAAQFEQDNLADLVAQALSESGLAPERLELEITETAIIRDRSRALRMLRQIKALGVKISMDDFGTGYASLDTLTVFPFDKIKIDRSFLVSSDDDSPSRSIVRTILALGLSLRMPVLAEGVETMNQLAFLKAEGCHEAQGYLLGRPMPAAELHHAA